MKTNFYLVSLLLWCMSSLLVRGQSNYEVLYLKGDNETLIEAASNKANTEDYYWLGFITNREGNLLGAIDVLEEGLSIYSADPSMELLLTNFYYESGNFVKAKPLLEKFSDSHENFIRLIELLEFQNDFSEAIEKLESRLISDSLNLSLLIHLGDNYYQLDSNKIALQYYEKVYSINPNDQSTANKLASILVKEKEYERSIEICDEVLGQDSLNKKFIRIKGSASFNNKNYITSNSCFGSLYEMGDSGVFVLKHLGLGEIEQYNYVDARKHLLGAYQKSPDDFEICFMLGRGFLNSRTPEKGLYYLERLDSLLLPDTVVLATILLEKRSIYATLEDYEKVLACYKKAYAYDPKPGYIYYIASLYQYRFDEPELALEFYTKFLEMLPPPVSLSDNPDLKGQITITMRSAAENSITELREKLFFEGKLEE